MGDVRGAATVKANLESISSSIGTYMNNHCLVLNQEKSRSPEWAMAAQTPPYRSATHWPAPAAALMSSVSPSTTASPQPRTWRPCSALPASWRLSIHLRLPVLKQVIRALLVGKVGYACAVLKPRLLATDPVQKDQAEIQTAVNDCARAIIGSKRSNRMPIPTLLAKAGIPSMNQLIVEQLAIETWKAMN